MGSNEEHGIAQSQIAAAKAASKNQDGLQKYHSKSISYINERIVAYLFILLLLVIAGIWFTSSSIALLGSSFVFLILIIVLWGVVRIDNIKQERLRRENDVKNTARNKHFSQL